MVVRLVANEVTRVRFPLPAYQPDTPFMDVLGCFEGEANKLLYSRVGVEDRSDARVSAEGGRRAPRGVKSKHFCF